MARSVTIPDAAEVIGCSPTYLYEHRVGDTIDMGAGQTIHLISVGSGWRVPNVEIARYLHETPEPEEGQAAQSADSPRDVTQRSTTVNGYHR